MPTFTVIILDFTKPHPRIVYNYPDCNAILTVPLKSKLTLETGTSRLDPRASMLETFEDRVSSIES